MDKKIIGFIIGLIFITFSLLIYFIFFYKKNESCNDDSDCDNTKLNFCIEKKCTKLDCLVNTDCKSNQICDLKGSHTCLCDSYSYKASVDPNDYEKKFVKKYIGKDCQYSDIKQCRSMGSVDENGNCDCYLYQSLADNSIKKRLGDNCQFNDNDSCNPTMIHPNYGIVDKEGNCVYKTPECTNDSDCDVNKKCDMKTKLCLCDIYKSLADSTFKRRLGDNCEYSDNDTCKPVYGSLRTNHGVVDKDGKCSFSV
jgi:hypothetical protein